MLEELKQKKNMVEEKNNYFFYFFKNNNLYYIFFYLFFFFLFLSFLSYTIPLYKIICGLNEFNLLFNFFLLNNSFFYFFFFSFNIEFNYYYFFFYFNNFYILIFFFFYTTVDFFSYFYFVTFFFSNELIQVYFFTRNNISHLLSFDSLQHKLFLFKSELSLVFFRIYNKLNIYLNCFSVYVVFPVFYFSFINKLQCFCFDIIRIFPFEIIDLPVIFFILKNEQLNLNNLVYSISITYLLLNTN